MKGGGQGLLITRSLNQRDLRSIRAVILNNPEAMQLLCPLPARTAALRVCSPLTTTILSTRPSLRRSSHAADRTIL